MLSNLLFYIFSAGAVLSAIGVISSRRAVHGVLWLVSALCMTAGLFILLKAFLVAMILVLVYAGAILVLFLFVVMLMDIHETASDIRALSKPSLFGVLFVATLVFLQILFVIRTVSPSSKPSGIQGTAQIVGLELFSRYLLPFELTSFLLLAAVVGVVVLAKKDLR